MPASASTSLPVSPSSEIHTQLQYLPVILDTDIPGKISLKRKIGNLPANERLKSIKIRKLQRGNWRVRKKITSLQGIVDEFKRRNILEEESMDYSSSYYCHSV
jgi:hypothetical protein